MEEEKLPPELREKLLEVELAAEAEAEELKQARFDKQKALIVGLFSLGMGFTLGIAMQTGLIKSLIFGVFCGLVGSITGACQRPPKKQS